MANVSPVILSATILSNGSMAVLAGNPYKHVDASNSATYYGFDDLQVAIVSANNTPVSLNQSSTGTGILNFASAGDSPNDAVSGLTGQGDETTGSGTIAALANGDMAIVTWGDLNHNYDLQILNSSGQVVTAPFVIANDLAGSNPEQGNPRAVIASNGSEFVVAWNTDDITGLYYERFSLTGAPIGGVVTVKTASAINPATAANGNPANNNSNWGGSLAIDSQGNVILGFGSTDIYHSGYFEEYNSSNTQLVGAPSSSPVMGQGAILNQIEAPVFAPVAGGGFITAGYTINPGTFNLNPPAGTAEWSNYNQTAATWKTGTYTLNVQKISTTGSVSTIATVGGFSGAVQVREAYGETTLSNGLVAFQEDAGQTGDQATNDWDTIDPSNNALTRDAFSVTPGTDSGPATPYTGVYLSIPYPVTNTSGGGLSTLSVNSSNQLVASGLNVGSPPPPPPPVTISLVSDTGSSNSDNVTSNDALTGGGDASAVVTLTENSSTLGTTTANGSGTWSFTPAGLTQGSNTIVASETDANGTGSASLTFTYDTVAPAVSESLVSDTGSSNSDKVTSNDAVTGGGDANAVVTLTENSTTLGTATANGSGTWTFTPIGLGQGSNTIVASETDLAGNTGSATLTFTYDTIAPAVTVQTVSGTSPTPNADIQGGGDPNAVVTITEASTTLGIATASGTGSWTFDPTGLANGSNTLVASETDLAGNTGSASVTFDLETTATFNVNVFNDINDAGIDQAGDPGVAGVTVNLLDGSGNPTGHSSTTNANGDASFLNLAPGTYEMGIVTPGGDIVTETINVNTPNTLTGGQTASATEGVFQAPAGTYVPPGATAPTTDPAGTYSPPGSTAPTQAPPGSYVPTTGATAPTTDPTGTYTGSPGATAPTQAPPGSYVPTTGATAPSTDPTGTYTGSPGATAPTQAPAGSYVGSPGSTAPTQDPIGTYTSTPGATAPTQAPAGSYVNTPGSTAPTQDPIGTYTSSPGATAPTQAPAGSYVDTPGATAPTQDPIGTYTSSPGATAPTQAPAGSYVGTAGATAPTQDMPGTYTSSPGATAPTAAPAGSYVGTPGATAPTQDPIGTFTNAPGASAPTQAPAGSYVGTAGATAPTQDPIGTYSIGGATAPTQAPAGTYVGTAGATAPTQDSPGTYTSSPGSTAPTQAPAGSYVGTAGATAPTQDPIGTYTSSPGASAPTQSPAGSYVGTAGATAPTQDPIGTYSAAGATAPTPAPAGSYVGSPGASAPTTDPVGTYTSSPGATAPTQAPAGSFVGTTGATAPTTDPVGTYTSSPGASAPTQAPAGSYVGTSGATAPTTDPIGTYSSTPGSTAPTKAPAGTYVSSTGATAPTSDPVGTYTNTAGATAPTVIPAGFYDPTPSGTPIGAPAGTYIPGTGATSAGAEIPAPAGYYDAGTGNTAPKIDPAGSYTGSPGSTAPILAPTGTYVPTAGATAPTVAPPGYYDPGTGNTAPILLPVEVWAKGVSGSWQTAKNWSPASVPGATTNAELTAAGFYTVTSSQSTTVGAIRTNFGATLDITGGSTFTLLAGTGTGTNAGAVLVGVNSLFATSALLAAPTAFVTSAYASGDPTLTLSGPFVNAATGLLLANDATIDVIGGSITGGNVIVGYSATLEATGGGSDTVNTVLTNFGLVEAGTGTSLTLAGTTNNAGILEAMGGGTLSITGPLANYGLLDADGGNVTVSANQISGSADIYSASKMTFLGSSTSVAASFQNNAGNTGILALAKAGSFTGTVAGFFSDGTHSDTLDLGSIGFASGVTWSFTEGGGGKQGVLTVSDHSGDTAKITLIGGYLAGGKTATSATSSIFQLASDGATPTAGTLVTTKVL